MLLKHIFVRKRDVCSISIRQDKIVLLLVSKKVQGSKSKARKNSSLYNSNRHIALINLYERLQKKREKLISAL